MIECVKVGVNGLLVGDANRDVIAWVAVVVVVVVVVVVAAIGCASIDML